MAKDYDETKYEVDHSGSAKEHFPLDNDTVDDKLKKLPNRKKKIPKEILSKVGNYSKNVIKSSGKLTVDILGKYSPNVVNFGESMYDVYKLAKEEGTKRLSKIKDFIKENNTGDSRKILEKFDKTISETKRDIVNRIKSGEFYKNDMFDTDGMFGDFDIGDDFSFDDNFDTGTFEYSDPETTLSDEPFGDVYTEVSKHEIPRARSTSSKLSSKNAIRVKNSSGGISSGDELMSSIITDVGRAIIDQQNTIYEKNYALNELRFSQHIETQRGILSAANATIEHLQTVEGELASSTLEYQNKMINFQQEQLAIMREVREYMILGLPKPEKKQVRKSKLERVLSDSGRINPEEYWKNIKGNFSDVLIEELGPVSMMLPMLSTFSDMGIKPKFDPLSMALKGLVNSQLSSKTRAKMTVVDEMMKNAGSLWIGKMNDLASNPNNSRMLRTIGRLFGAKDAYVHHADYGVSDPNKVVGWTAKSDRTLNEVIPDRLNEIVSLISGNEKEHYDYKTGQFVTRSFAAEKYKLAKQEAYQNSMVDSAINEMSSDGANKMLKDLNAAKIAGNLNDSSAMKTFRSYKVDNIKDFQKELNKDFQTIRANIGKTQSMFNPSRLIHNDNGKDNYDAEYYRRITSGLKNPESLALFIDQYMQMSSIDAGNFNGEIINQNIKASRHLREFSEDMMLYGGATEAANIENLDKADAMEYELNNSVYYSDTTLKNMERYNPIGAAARRKEIARKKREIRTLRNKSNKTDNAEISKYGFVMPSSENAGGNISSTLGNIFNLLRKGIIVYARDGSKEPDHIRELNESIVSNEARQKEYKEQQRREQEETEQEWMTANADLAKIQRQMYIAGKFTRDSFFRDILGSNKERNNSIDTMFNRGFSELNKIIGKHFAGGITNTKADDLLNTEYGKHMKAESERIVYNFENKINRSESELEKLKDKNDPVSVSLKKYHKLMISINRKALNKFEKNFKNNSWYNEEINPDEPESFMSDSEIKELEKALREIDNASSNSSNSNTDIPQSAPVTNARPSNLFENLTENREATSSVSSIINNDSLNSIWSSRSDKTLNEIIPDKLDSIVTKLDKLKIDVNYSTLSRNEPSVETENTRNVVSADSESISRLSSSFNSAKDNIISEINNFSESIRTTIEKFNSNVSSFFDRFKPDEEITENNILNRFNGESQPENQTTNANDTSSAGVGISGLFNNIVDKVKGSVIGLNNGENQPENQPEDQATNTNSLFDNIISKLNPSSDNTNANANAAGFGIGGLFNNIINKVKPNENQPEDQAINTNSLSDNIVNKAKGSNSLLKNFKIENPLQFIFAGKEKRKGILTDIIMDKFFTNKEFNMDEVEEEYRIAMSAYASLDVIEKSLNTVDPSDMKADKKIISLIKEEIKLGHLDKDMGNNVIELLKDYKEKGYPPMFAITKIKESIKEKYTKKYKKVKRSHSGVAKFFKSLGKWTGTTVGGTVLIASGHPFMAATLIGNSLRTNPAFQKMIKKKADKHDVTNETKNSLFSKATDKYGVETNSFDKLLGINAMDRMSKTEIENEEKIAASTFAAIDEIEKQVSGLDLSDKKVNKEIVKLFKQEIKKGSIDKDIGDQILDRMNKKIEEGKSPVEALSEAKETIRKNYSKVFRKQKWRNSKASKILKGFGKTLGIGLTAMYNPVLAAIMVGREIARHKQLKEAKQDSKDRDQINSIMGQSAMNEKYKSKQKPNKKGFFDNIISKLNPSSDNTDTDTNVDTTATAGFGIGGLFNNILNRFNGSNDGNQSEDQTTDNTAASATAGFGIGGLFNNIINKVKPNENSENNETEDETNNNEGISDRFVAGGLLGNLINRIKPKPNEDSENNETEDESNKEKPKGGLINNFINKLGIGGLFRNNTNESNEESNEIQPDTETNVNRVNVFSSQSKPKVRMDDGEIEGSYADQLNDAKEIRDKQEKEKKEKEKLSIFKSIDKTLIEIKLGLGIRDKGDEIDEKDDETLAGKMEQIRKETKNVRDSVKANTVASTLSGGGRGKFAIVKDLLTVGGGLAVTASVATNIFKAANRSKDEGAAGVTSQLTGLDKSSESNYNYDGTKKQADFHLGGENGVDIDLDRGFERTHNGALIATNAKRWKDAGKRLIVDTKDKASKIMSKFGKGAAKGAANSVDDVAEAVVEKGGAAAIKKLPKTVLSKIKDGLVRFLGNKKVAKFIDGKKAKSVVDTIMKKLSGNVPANVAKNAAKAGGKGATKGGLSQIPVAGWIAAIVFVVWDFLNGMSKVNRYFKVSKNEDITAGMRITAGLVEAIPSLLGIIPVAGVYLSIATSMLPPDWLTQNLYKLFVNKEAEEKLKEKQEAAVDRANKLGVDADRLNEYENRSWGQHAMDWLRSDKKKDERDAKLLGFSTVEEYKEWQKGYDKLVAEEKKANKDRKQKEKEEKKKNKLANSGSGAPASAAMSSYNKLGTNSTNSNSSNYGPKTSAINAAKANSAWASDSKSNPTSSPTAGYDFANIKGPKAAKEAFKNNRRSIQYQVEDAFNRSPSAAIALGDQIVDSRAKGQQTNINTLSPEFKKRVDAFLNDPRIKGQGVKIREGYRSPLTQYAYYSKGRAPKEVTDALMKKAGFAAGINFWGKGFQGPGQNITWTLASNHFDGNAVDLEPGKIGYDKLGEIAKEYGIEWGGSWEKSPDRPHFEIDKNFNGKIPEAKDIESKSAPKSQYEVEFESTSAQARTADGKIAPENESNKTTNPKIAKQVEEAKVKGITPSYKVEYGVNGPSHSGTTSTSTSTGTKPSASGGNGSSSSSYKGSTTSNPATVKESPFVTNDKLLVKEMQNMLKVQQAIKDEMVRHNGVSEGFYEYIMDYFKKHAPTRTLPKDNNNNYLYSNENDSNDDSKFAANTESLSKGLLG